MFHPQGPTFVELAHQACCSTERGYDLLAPKFDYTPFRTPQAVLNVVARHLGRTAPFDSALDVCCGTGAGLEILAPICRRRRVGIDFSRRMLEVAEQKLRGADRRATIELVRGNALEMTFDGEFDVAVCFGAHGHILPSDEARFVDQVFRALRPGGRFVFVTAHPPPFWSRSYWFSRGFNAAMRFRNLLIRPPFIMYYLTFLLPRIQALLEEQGFNVEVFSPFPGRRNRLRLVVATRPG